MDSSKRPRVGDECWLVEWCSELAFYDDSEDVDRDNCKMKVRRAACKEDAERIAREVYPATTTTFGGVEYYPARFVPYDEDDAALYPHAGYWEETADSEYYEGE